MVEGWEAQRFVGSQVLSLLLRFQCKLGVA